jgi:hypothetical protein
LAHENQSLSYPRFRYKSDKTDYRIFLDVLWIAK